MKLNKNCFGWVAVALAFGLFSGEVQHVKAQTALDAKSTGIPPRPEELKFPPLKYEPPVPTEYRVPLKSGPVAYVIPDKELPLVNIAIYVHTGNYLVPKGKEGLADLTGYLLARGGTKSKKAEEVEERLAFLAAQLNSGIGDNQGSVSLNLLSKDLDEGLSILREVLSEPRFQDNKIELRKQQLIQAMKERNDDSSAIEARELGFLAQGEDFWANHHPTAASVEGVTRAEMEEFHRKWFFPSNFVVAVNGDFDRATMVQKLENLFANWPYQGEKPPSIPTNTVFAKPGVYVVDKDVNQGRVSMILPGILRDNPDYFSVLVMNDILGGGGFTSRIMNSVRSDEGLAYSAYSSFPGGVYYPSTFTAGFQSKSRTVTYAASIVSKEIKKMTQAPPTNPELSISKSGFIDRFPHQFATKGQVANIFAQDEFTGRYAKDPTYWQKFRDRINAVTAGDVQRVAQQYLRLDKLVILIVGQKKEIAMSMPDRQVPLDQLAGGPVVELPLRDPLTMKPMSGTQKPAAQ
jgi:zinc protease